MTWSGYRWELEHRVVPSAGRVKLHDLNAAQLNRLYTDLLREGGQGGRPLSPRSVQYVHAILRKALDDAVTWGLPVRNPAARADPPSQSTVNRSRREMVTWSAHELRRFLDHVREDRLAAAWLLAATTGMRRGEVLGLRWADLDMAAGRLAVRQTLVMVDGHPRLSLPKTPRSRRTIDLDSRTLGALRRWRGSQEDDRRRWRETWQDRGLVFTREHGGWVAPDGWSAAFDRHVLAAGLPRIRLHDLRHTHATLLLASGTPPKAVSERLGHTTIAFTLDTYAHVVPGMQAEAADRFAALLFDSPSHEFRDQIRTDSAAAPCPAHLRFGWPVAAGAGALSTWDPLTIRRRAAHGRRMRLVATSLKLALLLAAEVAAVVLLVRLGGAEWARVGWDDPLGWLAVADPGDAVAAVGRLVALGGAVWLTATTVLAVAARLARVPAAVRALDVLTLPAVRRLADQAVAVALATSSLAAPAGVAVAAPAPQIAAEAPVARPADLDAPGPAGPAGPGAPEARAVAVAWPGLPPPPAPVTDPAPAPAGAASAPAAVPAPLEGGEEAAGASALALHTVRTGDSLWDLAQARVARATGVEPSAVADRDVHAYWVRVLDANRDRIPSHDPDLIRPGESVVLPPLP